MIILMLILNQQFNVYWPIRTCKEEFIHKQYLGDIDEIHIVATTKYKTVLLFQWSNSKMIRLALHL